MITMQVALFCKLDSVRFYHTFRYLIPGNDVWYINVHAKGDVNMLLPICIHLQVFPTQLMYSYLLAPPACTYYMPFRVGLLPITDVFVSEVSTRLFRKLAPLRSIATHDNQQRDRWFVLATDQSDLAVARRLIHILPRWSRGNRRPRLPWRHHWIAVHCRSTTIG